MTHGVIKAHGGTLEIFSTLGQGTTVKLRALYPDLCILISSGQPDIEEWPCFKQPNVAVISKPFELDELLTKLAQFVPKTS